MCTKKNRRGIYFFLNRKFKARLILIHTSVVRAHQIKFTRNYVMAFCLAFFLSLYNNNISRAYNIIFLHRVYRDIDLYRKQTLCAIYLKYSYTKHSYSWLYMGRTNTKCIIFYYVNGTEISI